jgi:hypothetical protein
MFRDWNAYGFNPGQAICEAEDVVFSRGGCKAPCRYDWAVAIAKREGSCAVGNEYAPCDRPCDSMVQLAAPPVFVMYLSYFSQSAIICVLAMSTLTKAENVKIWKKKCVSEDISTPSGF